MEANRKRVQVHMLPTNGKDIAMLSKRVKDGMLQSANGPEGVANCNTMWQPQHLYFTTDEEIKEGDWYLLGNTPRQSTGDLGKPDTKWLKIIASTDPKLLTELGRYKKMDARESFTFKKGRELPSDYKLPQPSQAFIEKFCKVGGIEYVNVEYTRDMDSMQLNIDSKGKISSWKLKVDFIHNTITIHPIKDSWSKEEVIAAGKEAFSCGVRLWEDWEEEDYNMWDNFVKENF